MTRAVTRKQHSIRYYVIITLAVSFLIMFSLLYALLSRNMQDMLLTREEESLQAQLVLASSGLEMSTQVLPTLTSEWAELSYTYDYVVGKSEIIYHSHFTQNTPFEVNRLNLLAIIDTHGNIMFERFYNYDDHHDVRRTQDLTVFYQALADRCTDVNKLFRGDMIASLGASGFVVNDGRVYYLSAHPISNAGDYRNRVGTLIFGRFIDRAALDSIFETGGTNFSISSVEKLPLCAQQRQQLLTTGRLTVTDETSATAYSAFRDYLGDYSLAISIENDRQLYTDGQHLIQNIILFVAGFCVLLLLVTFQLLNRIVVRPISHLAETVQEIDVGTMDQAEELMSQGRWNNNLELFYLSDSIQQMLLQLKQANESLHSAANYDTLTGLRNRFCIVHDTDDLIAQLREAGDSLTLYQFDIDRFKSINDTLGHHVGDMLIQAITKRLCTALEESTLVARTSGDEFVLVVPHLKDTPAVQAYAHTILAHFSAPFAVGDRMITVSVSMGSATYPQDGQDAITLIKCSEIAMYNAKESGDGLYSAYQSDLQKDLQRRIAIENELRDAIGNGCRQFELYYQPKLSLTRGEIVQCEALIRWNRPDGLASPGEFIPHAEKSGLIVPLTWWIIEACCRQLRQFDDAGLPMQISVNIPAQVLINEQFIPRLQQSVDKYGVDIRNLDIEITEGTLLGDIDQVNQVLTTLHDMGLEISVDDFGTGYSSLSYLNRLAVDRIKIDRSFISGVSEDEDCQAIVQAIIVMAKALHMSITAEGVENASQMEFLRNTSGCEEIQGYFISRPLPADAYIAFVQAYSTPEEVVELGQPLT